MTDKIIHAVYAIKSDNFQVLQIPEGASLKETHHAIANFENDQNQSQRRWSSTIKPGSFMVLRVKNAIDNDHAIEIAQRNGLSYLPISEAYKINQPKIETISNSSQASEDFKKIDEMFEKIFGTMPNNGRNNQSFRP